ncbi:Uncharacterized protein HZ326_7731 [Fusarium oxysporum f. sp. albedinis]|nr:Uncharacterized protein HZ326_7731 [Fusarium oxysporum f. sp. albedinis]
MVRVPEQRTLSTRMSLKTSVQPMNPRLNALVICEPTALISSACFSGSHCDSAFALLSISATLVRVRWLPIIVSR